MKSLYVDQPYLVMLTRILFWGVICFTLSCSSLHTKSQDSSIYRNYEIGEHEWYLTNPADSVKLYILEYGKGKDTVLVLHGGFGAEHRYLKDAFEGLYDQFHFIFYDQRGSLRSPCVDNKISIQKHVEDIEVIRRELKMDKINLFGHSNGTTLATFYLKEHPNRVKAFVMSACMQMQYPIPESDTLLTRLNKESEKIFERFMKRPGVQIEVAKIDSFYGIPDSKIKTMKQRINMAAYYIYDISLWKKGKEPFGAFYSNKAANATAKSIPQGPYNNIELYKSHPYPITIIMGDYDMIDAGGKKFEYWTKDIPNVHYELIKNAGHDPWIDQPLEFKNKFLSAMKRYSI